MDVDVQLQQALKELKYPSQQASVMPAKVLAVDGLTIDVETVNGLLLYGVRLGASDKPQHYAVPQKGSWVLITPLLQQDSYAAFLSEHPVTYTLYAEEKFSINTSTDSLRSIFADLLSAIEQLNVSTPSGPSSTPNNIQSFSEIKKRVNDFFNE